MIIEGLVEGDFSLRAGENGRYLPHDFTGCTLLVIQGNGHAFFYFTAAN
jgi:hypothetical protein